MGRKEPDLAREIATSALLNLGSYRGRSQFSTWFYRLCRNYSLNYIRNTGRKREVDLLDYPNLEAPQFEAGFKLPSDFSVSDSQLTGLVANSYTWKEIGEVFGISASAAYQRWQKLRKRLMTVFAEKNDATTHKA
jgi:DNA-directed RNA polymerase specialized sigma24 family protein